MSTKQRLIANLTEAKRSPIFEVRQLKCGVRMVCESFMAVWPGAAR